MPTTTTSELVRRKLTPSMRKIGKATPSQPEKIDLARTFLVMAAQPQESCDILPDGGDIGGGKRGLHAPVTAVRRRAEADRSQHEEDDENRPDDVGGLSAMTGQWLARDGAFQNIAEGNHRHGNETEEDWNDVVVLDLVAENMQGDHADGEGGSAGEQSEDAGGARQPADLLKSACCLVLRQETDDGGVEAEAGKIAGGRYSTQTNTKIPYSYSPISARQNDLRQKGDGGADNADKEGGQRHALGGCAFSPRAVKEAASERSIRLPAGRRPAGIFSAVSMTAITNTQNSSRQIVAEVLPEQR